MLQRDKAEGAELIDLVYRGLFCILASALGDFTSPFEAESTLTSNEEDSEVPDEDKEASAITEALNVAVPPVNIETSGAVPHEGSTTSRPPTVRRGNIGASKR